MYSFIHFTIFVHFLLFLKFTKANPHLNLFNKRAPDSDHDEAPGHGHNDGHYHNDFNVHHHGHDEEPRKRFYPLRRGEIYLDKSRYAPFAFRKKRSFFGSSSSSERPINSNFGRLTDTHIQPSNFDVNDEIDYDFFNSLDHSKHNHKAHSHVKSWANDNNKQPEYAQEMEPTFKSSPNIQKRNLGAGGLDGLTIEEELMALVLISSDLLERNNFKNAKRSFSNSKRSETSEQSDSKTDQKREDVPKRSFIDSDSPFEKRSFRPMPGFGGITNGLGGLSTEEELMALVLISSDLLERVNMKNMRRDQSQHRGELI